jgi:hypothetical protein
VLAFQNSAGENDAGPNSGEGSKASGIKKQIYEFWIKKV